MAKAAKYQPGMPCSYPDCFSCPHPDCIRDRVSVPGRTRGPSRRTKYPGLSPEEARAESNRAYRERNREEINRKNRERYHRKKKEREEQANGQKHLPDSQAGQRHDSGAGS